MTLWTICDNCALRAAYRGFPLCEKLNFLAVLLRYNATDWHDNLPAATKANWDAIKTALQLRYQDSDLLQCRNASQLWNRVQSSDESVDRYITCMRKLAPAVGMEGEQLCYILQRGLRPQLLAYMIQSQPTSVDDFVKATCIMEATCCDDATEATSFNASFSRVVAVLAAYQQARSACWYTSSLAS